VLWEIARSGRDRGTLHAWALLTATHRDLAARVRRECARHGGVRATAAVGVDSRCRRPLRNAFGGAGLAVARRLAVIHYDAG
jgi:hypothetical protein